MNLHSFVSYKGIIFVFFPTHHLRFLRVKLHPRGYFEGNLVRADQKFNFTILRTDITDQGVQHQFAF